MLEQMAASSPCLIPSEERKHWLGTFEHFTVALERTLQQESLSLSYGGPVWARGLFCFPVSRRT